MGETDFELRNDCEFTYLSLTAQCIPEKHCVFVDRPEAVIDGFQESVSMVLTTPELADEVGCTPTRGLCIVDEPRLLFFRVHNHLAETDGYRRPIVDSSIDATATIAPSASISRTNVTIGKNVIVEENVVIRANTVIGDGSIIRAGAVVGGHGFEFKHDGDTMLSVAHCGGVRLGRNVELQYNTCVDRAVYPWDDTILGDNTKVDNLVHIGHAAKTASNVMIVANSGIGGRTTIGANTWIGFGATVINGIEVGSDARVNIGSTATRSVPSGESVTGNFAIPHKAFIKHLKDVVTKYV